MHVVTLGQKKSNANLIRISYREVGPRHAIISISSLSIDAEDLQSLVATSEPILRMIAPCRLPSQNRIYMAAIACLLISSLIQTAADKFHPRNKSPSTLLPLPPLLARPTVQLGRLPRSQHPLHPHRLRLLQTTALRNP